MHRIITGDILAFARHYKGPRFHAVLCDPPYHLTSIVKRFSGPNAAPAQYGRDGAFARVSTGFMGQTWDGGDVAFRPDTWVAIASLLYPGAYLLAFGGTRTYHRLACAIEDAGFEIRDMVAWLYGSGFPKSLDVSKAIDKAAGAERTVVGRYQLPNGREWNLTQDKARATVGPTGHTSRSESLSLTAPATPDSAKWQGWGTALKPAIENIILARKPFDGNTELGIIVGNLSRLEAQLWLLLPANIAELNSTSNPNGYGEAFAIAQWTADDQRDTQADLCAQMDTSQYEWAIHTTLSTVSSWRNTWEEALRYGSTFTIETATSPTITLQTLNSSVLALTPRSIIQAATIAPGSWWNVLPAASILSAVAGKLNAILELSAIESVIDAGRIPRPDAVDQERLSRPVIVARKPLEGTVAENVLKYGTGAMNIDGCRVEVPGGWETERGEAWLRSGHGKARNALQGIAGPDRNGIYVNRKGRWPANLIHDGSEEVLAGFPQTTTGSGHVRKSGNARRPGGWLEVNRSDAYWHGDSGSAARYFYCAKADTDEREAGLLGHIPCAQYGKPDTVHDPDDGTGLTTRRHHRLGEDGLPIRDKGGDIVYHDCRRCTHPTVKPLSLLRWLATLILPPPLDEPRRILIPFAGVASEMIGAMQAGWDEIVGVELHRKYTAIAKVRLDYYAALGLQLSLDLSAERGQPASTQG